MKISECRTHRPIILGDMGHEPRVLPPISDEALLAMQQPSTQRLMKMKDDEPFIATEDWRAVPDAKTIEEAIAMRSLDPQEALKYEADRKAREHEYHYRANLTPLIHPDNIDGTYDGGSSVSIQKKDKAIDALRFTPPAEVSIQEVKQKAVNLVEYKSEPIKEVWVEMNWFQAMIHKIRGNRIKEVKKDD